MFDLSLLKPEHFDHLIGSTLALADSEFCFTVRAVKRLGSPSPRDEPFTLSLLAAAGTQGPQGNYIIVHPQLGPMTIFLVPVATSDGQTLFEAVFN